MKKKKEDTRKKEMYEVAKINHYIYFQNIYIYIYIKFHYQSNYTNLFYIYK